jgi:hypothetical protein
MTCPIDIWDNLWVMVTLQSNGTYEGLKKYR